MFRVLKMKKYLKMISNKHLNFNEKEIKHDRFLGQIKKKYQVQWRYFQHPKEIYHI
jgi:hypothetical protein